jgi:hypothetical protein
MARAVFKFRGLVRGNLRVGKRVMNSLLRYHDKHDPGLPDEDKFFSAEEAASLQEMFDMLDAKMEEEKAR